MSSSSWMKIFCPRWWAHVYRTVRNVRSVRASLFFFILAVPSQVHNTPDYLLRSFGAHPPFTPFTFCLVDYKLGEPFSDISYTADKRWDEKYLYFVFHTLKSLIFKTMLVNSSLLHKAATSWQALAETRLQDFSLKLFSFSWKSFYTMVWK